MEEGGPSGQQNMINLGPNINLQVNAIGHIRRRKKGGA
jgi:hypothetical protein